MCAKAHIASKSTLPACWWLECPHSESRPASIAGTATQSPGALEDIATEKRLAAAKGTMLDSLATRRDAAFHLAFTYSHGQHLTLDFVAQRWT